MKKNCSSAQRRPEDYIKRHKQVHERLMEDIFDLSSRFSSDTSTGIHEVESFLSKWLILHILIDDKRHNQFF